MSKKKKEFNVEEDILSIANEIGNINSETRESLNQISNNPNKETVQDAITFVSNDPLLTEVDKKKLIDVLSNKYIELFNFDNCPEDYETLKEEAKYLSGMTQYSFLLMAQRLLKIRDNKLYTKDKYTDFKEFIENEINVSRQTVYKYIDIVLYYGNDVALARHDNDKFDYSKLLPYIPLLKADNENIPKDKIRKDSLEEMKKQSRSKIIEEANELKQKYGLIKESKKRSLLDQIKKQVENLSVYDIKELIFYLNEKII